MNLLQQKVKITIASQTLALLTRRDILWNSCCTIYCCIVWVGYHDRHIVWLMGWMIYLFDFFSIIFLNELTELQASNLEKLNQPKVVRKKCKFNYLSAENKCRMILPEKSTVLTVDVRTLWARVKKNVTSLFSNFNIFHIYWIFEEVLKSFFYLVFFGLLELK